MPAKKKSAPKKAASKQAKDNASLQHRKDQEAQDRNALRKKEREDAAKKAKEEEAAQDDVPKENDLVVMDIDGVPEAIRTVPMGNALKGLQDRGMHQRSGRVVGIDDSGQDGHGRVYVIDGADFTVRVPAAAVHKASSYKDASKPVAKKRARKRK